MTSPPKPLAPDAICKCRHFLGVPGGRGHAGDVDAKCTHRACGCRTFREDDYKPMPSYPPGDPRDDR